MKRLIVAPLAALAASLPASSLFAAGGPPEIVIVIDEPICPPDNFTVRPEERALFDTLRAQFPPYPGFVYTVLNEDFDLGKGPWNVYWSQDGQNDSSNIELPYAQMANSVHLFLQGLLSSWTDTQTRNGKLPITIDTTADPGMQFHGHRDYLSLAVASNNTYHDCFGYLPVRVDDVLGSYGRSGSVSSKCASIELSCGVFGNPALRNGVMVHEAGHALLDKHADNQDHLTGSSCPTREASVKCDPYYHHAVDAIPYGPPGLERQPHFPYQLEFEYFCDLSTHAGPDVPIGVIEEAASTALDVSVENLVNRPPFTCRRPTMFAGRDVPAGCDHVLKCHFDPRNLKVTVEGFGIEPANGRTPPTVTIEASQDECASVTTTIQASKWDQFKISTPSLDNGDGLTSDSAWNPDDPQPCTRCTTEHLFQCSTLLDGNSSHNENTEVRARLAGQPDECGCKVEFNGGGDVVVDPDNPPVIR